MNRLGSSDSVPPSYDSLEFEVTDIGEARLALDSLPPGILERERLDPDYWPSRRRLPQGSDRALTGEAIAWLMAMPPSQRPEKLAQQFPRVVNAIVSAWNQPNEAARVLEDLLTDRRGNRRGFPAAIREELHRLRLELASRMSMARGTVSRADELRRARELLEEAGYRVIPPVR